MEHWLPLFHGKLETLFDYLPGAAVTRDALIDDALDKRLETSSITTGPGSRENEAAGADDAAVYRPLPPEELYLTGEEWRASIASRTSIVFSPFRQPEAQQVCDLGGRRARDFAPERTRQNLDLFDAVRDYIDSLTRNGKSVVVAAYSPGTRDRLSGLLADHGVQGCVNIESWSEARRSRSVRHRTRDTGP